MITPVSILTINQICDRKNDLLVSADDIKKIADNAKDKAIDSFVKELYQIGEEREFDWEDIYRLSDKLKGVDADGTH